MAGHYQGVYLYARLPVEFVGGGRDLVLGVFELQSIVLGHVVVGEVSRCERLKQYTL